MTKMICVLISGMEHLNGTTAIQLVQKFNMKEYGGVKLEQVGKLWYGDFDSILVKNDELGVLNTLTELLSWFGHKRIKFRFDKSHLLDSQIDFRIQMLQDNIPIEFSKIEYYNG